VNRHIEACDNEKLIVQLDCQCRSTGLLLAMNPLEKDKKSWHDDLPFPRHWLSYIMLKIIVLVLAVALVIYLSGLL
jgi:hypothetical protein